MDAIVTKKILIIDASTLIEAVLPQVTKKFNFEIKTVKNVDMALVELIRWQPDLLITSIIVGNINAFELCLIVRMMPDFAAIPIVLMGSSDEKRVYHQVADAGADYYIKKDKTSFVALGKIFTELWIDQEKEAWSQIEQHPIRTVLLVDDSKAMRKIIKNILVAIGIEHVVEAKNGRIGLEMLNGHKIDLIISDWSMPIMNGVEMIKNIRLNKSCHNIPIVMVSAEIEEELEKTMNIGVNGYLRKPFNALEMKELISKFSKSLD